MKYRIEIQQQNIKTLLKLVRENPDLKIVPFVDTECVPSDDYSSWLAEWGKVKIDEIWISDDRVYCKSEDYNELIEEVMDNIDGICEKTAEEKINSYNWEKVIVVKINAQ